jgi:heat shock protein HslJ
MSEEIINTEEIMNIEEPVDGEETALETEPEPKQRNRRPLWVIGGLVVAVLALLACCVLAGAAYYVGRGIYTGAPPPTEAAPPQNPLANTNWKLHGMNMNEVPLPHSNITISFGADGSLSGNSGCNDYGGSYTVNGDALSVGPLMGTGRLCGDERDMQEQRYLAILQSAATFEMSRNQLIIRDATGQEVLRFD